MEIYYHRHPKALSFFHQLRQGGRGRRQGRGKGERRERMVKNKQKNMEGKEAGGEGQEAGERGRRQQGAK